MKMLGLFMLVLVDWATDKTSWEKWVVGQD